MAPEFPSLILHIDRGCNLSTVYSTNRNFTYNDRTPKEKLMKKFLLAALMLFSFASHAEQCASNIAELKNLVGNSGLSMNWKENTKSDQLVLRLATGAGGLRLKLTKNGQDWGDVTGIVCKKDEQNYIAKVSNIVWGPAAPGMVRAASIKQIKLKLPYHSLLKVSVSFFSFEFSPI
jgi:hypothetical protein